MLPQNAEGEKCPRQAEHGAMKILTYNEKRERESKESEREREESSKFTKERKTKIIV